MLLEQGKEKENQKKLKNKKRRAKNLEETREYRTSQDMFGKFIYILRLQGSYWKALNREVATITSPAM